MSLKDIEEIEYKYLMKYWYFLKFVEEEIVSGIKSMDDIKSDWFGKYGNKDGGISIFDVGSERIVYALLNGKIAGKPNSAPVSSDLFFEVEDAFIHIDLKSVTTNDGIDGLDNVRDFNTSIFIGENQNSYKGIIIKNEGRPNQYYEIYKPNLPTFYSKSNGDKKITLTFFICLLNNSVTRKCELISIMCLPNGKLEDYYGSRPLKAGKNHGKARFNFKNVSKFELLDGDKKRVRVIYVNPDMSEYLKKQLNFYIENFKIDIE
ncbi:hypothetical protein [Mycoplasma leonicaptivi]|uniref:hypothetical protein n=1 Tax=Mycoplasma leonicaptivi TaxID=36742 RepID=UPI000485EB02|nr:hypothetical protein [Mycoplasma leonicaptivi]